MRDAKVEVRVPAATKTDWQERASASGLTLSAFVVAAVDGAPHQAQTPPESRPVEQTGRTAYGMSAEEWKQIKAKAKAAANANKETV